MPEISFWIVFVTFVDEKWWHVDSKKCSLSFITDEIRFKVDSKMPILNSVCYVWWIPKCCEMSVLNGFCYVCWIVTSPGPRLEPHDSQSVLNWDSFRNVVIFTAFCAPFAVSFEYRFLQKRAHFSVPCIYWSLCARLGHPAHLGGALRGRKLTIITPFWRSFGVIFEYGFFPNHIFP